MPSQAEWVCVIKFTSKFNGLARVIAGMTLIGLASQLHLERKREILSGGLSACHHSNWI
jgi:hypothetical protein